MDLKKQFSHLPLCFIVLATIFFSCTKDDETDVNLFYGSLKTSYRDTIVFSRTGNKNMLNYDEPRICPQGQP